jgi:hypothetical protein
MQFHVAVTLLSTKVKLLSHLTKGVLRNAEMSSYSMFLMS